MYLKRLKSKASNPLRIRLRSYLTKGFVGPNGSGKSNITESLRWALGESSVRVYVGAKMPDVIFTQGQNRVNRWIMLVSQLSWIARMVYPTSGKRVERHDIVQSSE